MDSTSPDPSDPAHEERIARLTDAHCLRHQLLWLTRSLWLVPVDMLWALLARQAGVVWTWVVSWTMLRIALHLSAPLWARSLMPLVDSDPGRGLVLASRIYMAYSASYLLMFPAFFFGTDDLTRLLAMLLVASYNGTVLISASGQQATYWWTIGPPTLVMVAGWVARGGGLGALVAGTVLFAAPLSAITVRQQRRAWEVLVRLQERTQALASALQVERDRAEAAANARTRFFAAASHDLRQPLHALSINATTLDVLARRSSDSRLTELSQGIGTALAQSQRLLDALLDISRLDANAVPLRLADVDVCALLQQVHMVFAPLAQQRGLGFTLALPDVASWARTDADQLQRVLRNLLDNALKFTDAGAVSLSLERQGEALCIAVSDSGCGIAPADREKVFEEFYQVGNPARDRSKGLGLGLAIVRRTAGLLSAQVRLLPRPSGPGTRFEVVLPALDVAAACTPQAIVREAALPPDLLVLVVDDEREILQAVDGLLHTVGWQVSVAASAGEALSMAAAARSRWDAAVVDHRLPDTTGVQLALSLRECCPGLPVLVVTGDVAVQWDVVRHGLPLLHKPLNGTLLTRAIAAEVAASERWASRLDVYRTLDGGPPMNLIDALHGRRSVREFRPEPPPRAQVEDLIWHAVQIPRPPGSDDRAWAFRVIEGRDRLADWGARAKRYAAGSQRQAPSWAVRSDFEVFWGAPVAVLICARRGHPEAPFDCCRAGQNLALAAHAAGLGSCWIGSALPWLHSDEGRTASGVPAGYDASVVLALGQPVRAMPGRSNERPVISWSDGGDDAALPPCQ